MPVAPLLLSCGGKYKQEVPETKKGLQGCDLRRCIGLLTVGNRIYGPKRGDSFSTRKLQGDGQRFRA